MPMTYVPETGTRTWHPFLVSVARFLVPATKMADEIAAVCAMALIVYYIITNNLNNLE